MMSSEPPVKTFVSKRKFLGWLSGSVAIIFLPFHLFRQPVPPHQGLPKRWRGSSGEQPGTGYVMNIYRIFVSTELKFKLKYSQRLPLTQLCLGSPGKK